MTSSAPAVTVRAYLLGPPRIEQDGDAVALDTRKALALLAYLALTGRPQSRDHLATLFWPEGDQTRARSALRRTLSALNAALDGKGLRIARESLTFTGADVWVDALAFVDAAASDEPERWAEAAELWSGDLLSGFVVRDSPDFDDWQMAAADDLRRDFGAVLERLTQAHADSDPDAAIAFAKRWLEIDPLHEQAHRALMRLYAATGDRSSALRQYRACVANLERDLGVEPLDETTSLYESIRESRPSTDVREPEPIVVAAQVADLPFVGRSSETAALDACYDGVGRDGRLAVVAGEAGIGKTRLATEFLTAVRASGAVVLEARCHPEEDLLAFGTCVELLRSIPAERLSSAPAAALAEATRLIPELSELVPVQTTLDSPAARRRLFEGVADVLTACVGPSGVLFVDDAHWIDKSSRDVLRFLVRRLRGRSVLVLLTWRNEEVAPAHPLRRTLSEVQRASMATLVVLERLTREDVDALIGASGLDDLRATLYDETAGVPFFVAEYLRRDGGEPMPSGVRDLLSSRVEAVGRGAGQILAAAAVLGRAFDPAIVRETSGRTDEEIAAALDELLAANLISETDERYDFTHPKLRSYVYDATTLGRRRILHGRAAKALLRRARRHPELLTLGAHHLERSGDEDEAASVFKDAAEHARSIHANAEALAQYRSALALGHPDDADLHAAIGDLQTLSGRYADAISSYEKAAALGADMSVIGRKLGGVHHRLGDFASAETHYTEAEEALDGGPGRARLLAERSLNAHRAGLVGDATTLAAQALEVAQREDDARSLAQAHNIGGILATHRGEVDAARVHLQASLEIAEDLDDLPATAAALNNLALALRAEGAPQIAILQAQRALDLTRKVGDRHREAAVLSNLGDILRDLGHADEAMEHVKRSVEIFTDIGEPDDFQPEVWKLTEW